MGEVSALMLLIGGLYLIWRKVINWQTPVAYIATVAVLTVLCIWRLVVAIKRKKTWTAEQAANTASAQNQQ